MRKDEGEKKKGGSRGVFIVLVSLVLGFAGGVVWLNGEVAGAEEVLEQSQQDYDQMKRWQRSILKIRAEQKKSGGRSNVKPPDDINGIQGYLSSKAIQSKISSKMIETRSWEKSTTLKGWTEYYWSVRITGKKDDLLSRASIVKFLQRVEHERPYLKVKNLIVDYKEGDILKASIVISYLKKDS